MQQALALAATDPRRARVLVSLAAAAGDADARVIVAHEYLEEPRDERMAEALLYAAFADGHREAAFYLACLYASARPIHRQLVDGFWAVWLSVMRVDTTQHASRRVTLTYRVPRSLKIPTPHEANLLLLVAEAFYEENSADCVDVWERAAEHGAASAYNNLGVVHERGLFGKAKDDKKACAFYRKALAGGDLSAAFNMGRFFNDGLGGVAVNLATASKFYLIAMQQLPTMTEQEAERLTPTRA